MDPSLNAMAKERQRAGKLTILVGNSGDRSNQHIAALRAVYQQFGDTVNVVVPMGYPANKQAYIDEVRQAGLALFSAENLQILSEKWNLMPILRCCASATSVILFCPPTGDRDVVSANSGRYPVRVESRQSFLAGYGGTASARPVYHGRS